MMKLLVKNLRIKAEEDQFKIQLQFEKDIEEIKNLFNTQEVFRPRSRVLPTEGELHLGRSKAAHLSQHDPSCLIAPIALRLNEQRISQLKTEV